MSTKVPETFYPSPVHPGEPSGVGTFYPSHPYAVAEASGPFNNHATLTDGLVSVWPLSEDGVDAHGTNDLTNNNVVTFVAKGGGSPDNMPANVANFVAASSQYMSVASNSTLNFSETTGFTFSVWLKGSGGQFYASKDDEGANRQWLWNGGAVYQFDDGGGFITVTSSIGAEDIGVWRLWIVWYDPADSKLHFSEDNGATADSAGTIATLKETTTVMRIGESAASFYGGDLSSFYIWSRVLTAQERTDLYNSGDGLFYA